MKNYRPVILFLVVFIFFLYVDPVYAGPGGAIAKAFFKTWWDKVILSVIALILLPFIIYWKSAEYIGVKKSKKELVEIAKLNKDFAWLNLEKSVKNVFNRVYVAWNNEKMNEVSQYVSSWYWQNQQLVVLDEWKKQNLRNICQVDKITNIKPLYLEISDNDDLSE